MKIRQLRLLVGPLFLLAALLCGCSHSPPPPALTKENFGYPGMKMGPGYDAVMKKMRARNAQQAAGPPAPAVPATH